MGQIPWECQIVIFESQTSLLLVISLANPVVRFECDISTSKSNARGDQLISVL